MSLSAEAIIAILALFVTVLQLLCTLWTYMVKKKFKFGKGNLCSPKLHRYPYTGLCSHGRQSSDDDTTLTHSYLYYQ